MTNRKAFLCVVAAGVLLTGCGSPDKAPGVTSIGPGAAAGTPSPVADRARQIELYRECLVTNRVKLLDQPTEEGLPQVDKENTSIEVLSAAQEKCRQFQPSGGDVVKRSPADLEALRRYAVCLREHGVPNYPDPDPVTGDPRISDELSAQLKNDPNMITAAQQCQNPLDSGGGTGSVNG